MSIRLLLNGSLEETNISRRHFQESIRAFNPKTQVCKAKLQSFLEPSKVVFIMYSTNTLQVKILIKNILSFIDQDNGPAIEFSIQSEVSFLTNEDVKGFYKAYDRYDKYQRISHNHIKLLTVYCAPRFRNIMLIHLLGAFSSDPDPKYITSGTQ